MPADDPRMTCPKCGNTDCRADFVDNGVGMQQCGPYVCEPDLGGCGWVQRAFDNWPDDTDEDLEEDADEEIDDERPFE